MKKVFYIVAIVLTVFFISVLKPMNTTKENCIEVSGVVKTVSEGGIKDLVFELDNDKTTYYINRGFEDGFEMANAKKVFEGKKITLFYVNSWTPLAPFGSRSKHIAHVAINDKIIFSQW